MWKAFGSGMSGPGANEFVAGSNNSVVFSMAPKKAAMSVKLVVSMPPVTRIRPSARRTAAAPKRGVASGGKAVATAVAGSQRKASVLGWPSAPMPPATRIRPSASCARAANKLALGRMPIGALCWVHGSQAVTTGPAPPTKATRPSGRTKASPKADTALPAATPKLLAER